MKSLIIGDLHIGVHNNSTCHLNQSLNFFNTYIFPILNDIDNIILLGDVFDKRTNIDINILKVVKENIFDKLTKPIYWILGNHDVYYENTNNVNSSKLLNEYKNIIAINKPMTINNIDLIPWISHDNVSMISDYISTSKSKYCMGHFAFNGFKFDKTRVAEIKEKISQSAFRKYTKVFSGHFHTYSENNNIMYTGTPYELTWIDSDDEKSFYILDDDNIIKNVNNNKLYIKLNFTEAKEFTKEDIYGKIIKVVYDETISKDEVINLTNLLNSYEPESLTFILNISDKPKDIILEHNTEDVHIMNTIEDYAKLAFKDNKNIIDILNKSYKDIENGKK